MPESDENSQPETSPADGSVWSGFGIASAVLGLVALAAVGLVAVLWSGHRADDTERRHQAEAMAAAAEWTGVLINMNADNVEASLGRLRDGTVGELNSGFDASIAPYRDVVKTLRSRTTGQVESVSIEALHNELPGPDARKPPPRTLAQELAPELAMRTDTVLLVATSVSENAGGKPTTVRWNLRLGVSEVDGKPMISRLESVR